MNPLALPTAGTHHSSTAGFLLSVSFDLPRLLRDLRAPGVLFVR
jgi:hypothetical protein